MAIEKYCAIRDRGVCMIHSQKPRQLHQRQCKTLFTNQVMRSSARRRYKATLLNSCRGGLHSNLPASRAAAAWVAVLELLDLEDDDGADGDGPHTRLTRTGSHAQTTSSLRGRMCFATRTFSIPPPEQRSSFADASVFLTCFSSRWCVGLLRRDRSRLLMRWMA